MQTMGSGNLLWILISIFFSWFMALFGYYESFDDYEYDDGYSEYYDYSDHLVTVDEEDKPAMVEARLEGNVDGYYIRNTYDIDYMSRDVVGMVGVPIEVASYSEDEVNGKLKLIFVYDESKLSCDESDLGILWYNEAEQWYETVFDYETDYENNELSVYVDKFGTYIFEDMATWEAVWNGTYVYENTMMEPDCHWHNEFAYEDIEALADTSIYDEAGEYHITTIEQLAGLVKLVNEGRSFLGCNIYLDADLDLDGYEWAPIGWYYPADDGYMWKDFPFEGKFYGNGHAIYNMYISAPDQSDLGMFGRTLQNFEIHDFALIDCYIEGKYYVGGILGDNINSGEKFDMTNCCVSGVVVGQLKVGALVGSSAYINIKDCYAVMEEGSTMEVVGDLRGGYTENCHINNEEAELFLMQYIIEEN